MDILKNCVNHWLSCFIRWWWLWGCAWEGRVWGGCTWTSQVGSQ